MYIENVETEMTKMTTRKSTAARNTTTKRTRKTPAKKSMTVVQIAGAMKIDPKVARAKLRRNRDKISIAPENGRWPMVLEGSKQHNEIVSLLAPAKS